MLRFYHFCNPKNTRSILKAGLLINQPVETDLTVQWHLDFYDTNPVFLTTAKSDFIMAYREAVWAKFQALEVDTIGLPLVADLPSLIDLGAKYVEGCIDITNAPGMAPLARYADHSGWIEIEYLLDHEADVAKEAIQITQTAACIVNIQPAHIVALPMAEVFDERANNHCSSLPIKFRG